MRPARLRRSSGVNGAGKTTQLQIVMGRLTPDGGEVVKAKRHMKIAYLAQVRGVLLWPAAALLCLAHWRHCCCCRVAVRAAASAAPKHPAAACCRRHRCRSVLPTATRLQEFDVEPSRTVREEFYSVYRDQMAVVEEQERLSAELEHVGEDMERMQVCRARSGW